MIPFEPSFTRYVHLTFMNTRPASCRLTGLLPCDLQGCNMLQTISVSRQVPLQTFMSAGQTTPSRQSSPHGSITLCRTPYPWRHDTSGAGSTYGRHEHVHKHACGQTTAHTGVGADELCSQETELLAMHLSLTRCRIAAVDECWQLPTQV